MLSLEAAANLDQKDEVLITMSTFEVSGKRVPDVLHNLVVYYCSMTV